MYLFELTQRELVYGPKGIQGKENEGGDTRCVRSGRTLVPSHGSLFSTVCRRNVDPFSRRPPSRPPSSSYDTKSDY